MRRREFVIVVGGIAAGWPLAGRAQRRSVPVIGYLGPQSPQSWAGRLRAFHEGLSESGYVEGRNISVEYRWAEGDYDRFPVLVADLLRRDVSLIVAAGTTPGIVAAKAATSTVPIVFITAADPVESGFVASLNRPGGNLTGATVLSTELAAKQLQIIHEFVPAARVVALLLNPTNAVLAETQSRGMPEMARRLGLELHVLHARNEAEFSGVFASLAELKAGGLVIGGESLFTTRSVQLAALALQHAMPAIYQFREFAVAGGLVSYGASLLGAHRLLGVYAGEILKGKKPAELPVQQAVKFELVINLKTAKSFGIAVTPSLLAQADEVIE
jgi:putative tryptophan/tyrosine transport system substrate-binding protein